MAKGISIGATGEDAVKTSSNRPIIIIGALFFVFGFVTWLGSVLIPYLKMSCELNNFQSYLVAFSFYISYMVMAIPSSYVLKWTGFKNGMSVGLFIMALGASLFIPAALTRTYGIFLTGLFVQGTGLAILQTAANPYITILGPIESAAKRISIMGICNGIAGASAPVILGAVTLKNSDTLKASLHTMDNMQRSQALDALAHRVIFPYLIMVSILLVLSVLVYFSGLPDIDASEDTEKEEEKSSKKKSIFDFPHLILGVVTLFLYVGVEVIAGDTIIGYGASQGISMSTAKFFTSGTLICMLLGYLIGIMIIPKYISQQKALKISSLIGIVFALLALSTQGYISVTFIALLGLANSLMWPSIWPLAIADLGRFTKLGSSLMIMAIGGGAILPLIYGRLADIFSPHAGYWILIPCYITIWYYAFAGHKIRRYRPSKK